MKNLNCDGAHCISEFGEVRLLPYSSEGNTILCYSCFEYEKAFRVMRNKAVGEDIFNIPKWSNLAVYKTD